MSEFIFSNLNELANHNELGFPIVLFSNQEFQKIKDNLYGSFREIMKVPTGDQLSDIQLKIFLAAVYEKFLKHIRPDQKCKVINLSDDNFKVIW